MTKTMGLVGSVALLMLGAPAYAQDVSKLTPSAFLALEPTHQYAIAGAMLGSIQAMGENAPQPNPLKTCNDAWRENHPDTYITTQIDAWIDMLKIGSLGNPEADDYNVMDLFFGFWELSCAER